MRQWTCGGNRPPSDLLSALLNGELALDFRGGSGATGSRRYILRSNWTHCLLRAENLEAVMGEGFCLSVPVGDGVLKITLWPDATEKEVENRVDEEQDFRILSRVEEDVQENIESLMGSPESCPDKSGFLLSLLQTHPPLFPESAADLSNLSFSANFFSSVILSSSFSGISSSSHRSTT
ncbi:hypothetical protein MG293_014159 [Ovis ammon polii]|uniref:Uncharacterized protein n=1 Tax=Ovis ammon polii TaxID=230172 RepID=A0AAD4TX45_OVIAM|nr:hypothetical protein MG293_014159 [Ovis ammon polii]